MKTIITFIRNLLRKKKSSPNQIESQYVIARNQHQVSKSEISPNALTVVNKLTQAGFQAYLVGGSVRDLLLRHTPKDFDVSTNATPNQVKRLFRNARVIGRRFKLVHILFHREIIEVATFRGQEITPDSNELKTNERGMLIRDNVYGTLEQDAWRRDFTMNSLYYDVKSASIIDYTHGVADVKNRLIRIIGDAQTRYQEDPVRMLRAIRFSAKLKFKIAKDTALPIKSASGLIRHVASSRLFEEMVKLYHCGAAEDVHRLLIEHGLFMHLFPDIHTLFESKYPINALIVLALESTDTRIRAAKPVTPAFLFAVLLWFPLRARAAELEQEYDALTALEQAMSQVITRQNDIVFIPKRHTQVMREIWLLQFQFIKRTPAPVKQLLEHPRFRAAYDLLALRALAGDASMELAQWWTNIQEADEPELERLIAAQSQEDGAAIKRRKRRRKKPSDPGTHE